MTTYLDHNATAPPRPEVLDAVRPMLELHWANPASSHGAGRVPAAAVDRSRQAVAAWCGGRPRDVIFTSGATEANHAVLRGVRRPGRPRWLVSAVEHPSCRQPAEALGATVVPVDGAGQVDLDWLAAHLDDSVAGVSLMAANNETGVIQPLAEAHALCARVGAWLHVDATQALGRVTAPAAWDLLTLSGHKAGALKGVGVVVGRPGVTWAAQVLGGDQERGQRAGTVNVPAVVSLGVVVALALPEVGPLRDRLQAGAEDLGLVTTAAGAPRLPNTLHLRLPGVPGETLAQALDLAGVHAATGAACASGASKPSPVLAAMGLPADEGLRLSLGWSTTTADVDAALDALALVVPRCRQAFEVGA